LVNRKREIRKPLKNVKPKFSKLKFFKARIHVYPIDGMVRITFGAVSIQARLIILKTTSQIEREEMKTHD